MPLFTKKKTEAPVIQEPVHTPKPIQEPQPLKAEPATPVPTPEPAKKAPPKRKRPFDHHVWLSGEEERNLKNRAEEAGLSIGVFLRKCALETPVTPVSRSDDSLKYEKEIAAELKYIHAELGKHGGMLKMAIKPNEGQREADPEEWALLVKNNHEAVRIQKLVAKTMEAANGYFKTHQL